MYYTIGGSDHLLDIKQYYLFIMICLNRGGSRNNLCCFPDFKTDLHEVNVHRNTSEKKITFSSQESKQKTDKNLSVKQLLLGSGDAHL